MKIHYITDFDSTDVLNWSGLGVYYREMLINAGFDVNQMANLPLPNRLNHFIKRQFLRRVRGKNYSPRFNLHVSKHYGDLINKQVPSGEYILSPNTVVLAHLKKSLKKILFSDATFERLINFYPAYCTFTNRSLEEGHEVERLAIENADLLIYSSQWAADSAINYYGADPKKVYTAPFGANINHTPNEEEVKEMIKRRDLEKRVDILFLGVDWYRKGGDIALHVTQALNRLGYQAVLHVAGIKQLPFKLNHASIVNHGFIQKDTMKGQQYIGNLLSKCSFLLLPTLADCTPVAFSEASAFGLPCIATSVGGNPYIVRDHLNGITFSRSRFVEEAVDYIIKLIQSPEDYFKLCSSSYQFYNSELNWATTGKKIYDLIKSLSPTTC